MAKCPCCGFNLNRPFDFTKGIASKLLTLSPKKLKYIEKVASAINRNIPSENTQQKYYNFLLSIETIEEHTLKEGIEFYLKSNALRTSKGYAYLGAVINNWNKNKAKAMKNEKRIHGSSPKARKL